jgi:hypothetical protein
MLRHALNQHPKIWVSREMLLPSRVGEEKLKTSTAKTIIQDWQKWAKDNKKKCTHFGSLMHRSEYWKKPLGDVWGAVGELHEKFVGIYRHNLLRVRLSAMVSTHVGNWNCQKKRTQKVPPIKLDLADLEDAVLKFWRALGRVDMRYPGRLLLTYEEILLDWPKAMRQIQEYLGVVPKDLQQKTFKQENRTLRDSIANYDAVAKLVRSIGCEHWLEE